VRRLRIVIPTAIVCIAGFLAVATFYQPFRLTTAFPIDPGKVTIEGTKVTMELPRVTGFTSDQRPYELTATTAVQDLARLDVLDLNDLRAKVDLKDGQHVNITSIGGVYDTKAEVLRLNQRIIVTTSTGYEGHLTEATVLTGKGVITSDNPVDLKLPNGFLHAKRLEVRDNGAFIRFYDGVDLILNPEQPKPEQPKSDQPKPEQPKSDQPKPDEAAAQREVPETTIAQEFAPDLTDGQSTNAPFNPFAQPFAVPPVIAPAQAKPRPQSVPLPQRRVPSPQ